MIHLIRRPYKSSIGLTVKPCGQIEMQGSKSVSFRELEDFLRSQWSWVEKQLDNWKQLRKKYPMKKFLAGESFLFQGRKIKLAFLSGTKGFTVNHDHLIYEWTKHRELHPQFLRQNLLYFYEQEGKKLLKERVSFFSQQMNLLPSSLRIGSQKTLWGSCSNSGAISLNWRLLAAPLPVLEYVIIHELIHLKYLDHSKSFWQWVSRWCPDYLVQEKWLKNHSYALDFLLPRPELHNP